VIAAEGNDDQGLCGEGEIFCRPENPIMGEQNHVVPRGVRENILVRMAPEADLPHKNSLPSHSPYYFGDLDP